MLKVFRTIWYFVVNVGGVFGMLFGVWAFYQTRETKSLVYFFPEPAKIFDSTAPSRISVLDSKKRVIKDSIYLQEVTLWNNGNQPLEPEDIRESIIFGPENSLTTKERSFSTVQHGNSRILEFKVVKQVSPEVSKLRVSQAGDNNSSPRLLVSWEHFDPGHAAKIQVIYSASNDEGTPFDISGSIIGVRLENGNLTPLQRFAPWVPPNLLIALYLSNGMLTPLLFSAFFRRRFGGDEARWTLKVVLFTVTACLAVAFLSAIVGSYTFRTLSPPL